MTSESVVVLGGSEVRLGGTVNMCSACSVDGESGSGTLASSTFTTESFATFGTLGMLAGCGLEVKVD